MTTGSPSDQQRTSNVLAYAIRGSDNTTEVCLTETDARMKALKLSKVFPTVTFSVVELVERPSVEPPSQAYIDTTEMLREVEQTLIDLGWPKDRGVLQRVTAVLDAYSRPGVTKGEGR